MSGWAVIAVVEGKHVNYSGYWVALGGIGDKKILMLIEIHACALIFSPPPFDLCVWEKGIWGGLIVLVD